MRTVQIVIPCWNEEESIAPLTGSLRNTTKALDFEFVVFFVDDGSNDLTWQRICESARQYPDDKSANFSVRGIRLAQNTGKANAQATGLRQSVDADFVVLLDGDGQHPVDALPGMLAEAIREDSVVVGKRSRYERRIVSAAGTRGLKLLMSGVGLPFDPDLSEYVVMPQSVSQTLARSPRLGVVPVVPLLSAVAHAGVGYPIEISQRFTPGDNGRWSFTDLWRKALLQLLADPWRILPRITLIAVISFAVLFLIGVGSGVHAMWRGTSPGTVAILVSVVLLAAITVGMWVSSIVVSVMILRLLDNQSRSETENIETTEASIISE